MVTWLRGAAHHRTVEGDHRLSDRHDPHRRGAHAVGGSGGLAFQPSETLAERSPARAFRALCSTESDRRHTGWAGRAASVDADERTSLRSQRPYLDITIRTRRSGTRAHSPCGVHSGRSHNSIGGCTDRSTGSYPSISRTVDGHYCHRPAEEEMVVTICNEISSPRMPAGFAFSPYSERMTSSGVTNRGLNGRHHHV